jgi:hypothetical protein
VVFDRAGHQWLIIRCADQSEAERTIYHNKYYGGHCLKVTVKAWR